MNDFTRFFTQTSSKTPITLGQNMYSVALNNPELAGWLMSTQKGIYDADMKEHGMTLQQLQGAVMSDQQNAEKIIKTQEAINRAGGAFTPEQMTYINEGRKGLWGPDWRANRALGLDPNAAEAQRISDAAGQQLFDTTQDFKRQVTEFNKQSSSSHPTRYTGVKLKDISKTKLPTKVKTQRKKK